MKHSTKIARPALRYYGGKWRLGAWILSHFPDHVCYVEPFGGAMSVLLQKPPSYLEVYNDLDQDVVIFFRILRERTEELLQAIRLTPFSRSELAAAYEPAADELERARRLYVRSWQSIGGSRTERSSGWRFQKNDARGKRAVDDWNNLDHLYAVAERLKIVYVENDDALAVIGRYDEPTTLFYCDPPYPASTRTRWKDTAYQHEMSDDDHRRLADSLHGIRGMAIVSSYPCALYEELYADWTLTTKMSRVNMNRNGGKLATECLWLSRGVVEQLKQKRLWK